MRIFPEKIDIWGSKGRGVWAAPSNGLGAYPEKKHGGQSHLWARSSGHSFRASDQLLLSLRLLYPINKDPAKHSRELPSFQA